MKVLVCLNVVVNVMGTPSEVCVNVNVFSSTVVARATTVEVGSAQSDQDSWLAEDVMAGSIVVDDVAATSAVEPQSSHSECVALVLVAMVVLGSMTVLEVTLKSSQLPSAVLVLVRVVVALGSTTVLEVRLKSAQLSDVELVMDLAVVVGSMIVLAVVLKSSHPRDEVLVLMGTAVVELLLVGSTMLGDRVTSAQ